MSQVEIPLSGKTETLKCTLRAAREVNRYFGGFQNAYRKLAEFDLDAYFVIVAAGLNKKPKDIEEAVYAEGLPQLTGPLSTYVTLLANGGREPSSEAEDDKSGES